MPILVIAAALGAAQATGLGLPPDPRIRTVSYSADQVVPLPVSTGYAAVVALGPDERVENIVVGDSAGWQVTASKRGDDVVVKPLAGAGTTNMVITTGDRHYVLQLQVGGGEAAAPYVLRFRYPDAEPVALAGPAVLTTFTFSGARQLIPDAMSDDGVRTTIRWGKDVALPAVFAVEQDGHEALVNGRMVDGALVVERVAPRFAFRLGKARVTATRQTAKSRR